jgi:hypothetical protein
MPQRIPTVDGLWQEFARAVMPPHAPADQVREMRRAFFGGAWAMLTTVEQIGDEAVSEDQGVAILEALARECRAFKARVGVDR